MKKGLIAAIIGLSVIACPFLYVFVGPELTELQLQILIVLSIITASSGAYCFIVGEITKNNSQMDKLWSILPEVYLWVIAIMSGMHPRLIVMAVIATIWGARLTFNFAKKGAYRLKFWEGEEDYRWKLLREKKEFQPRWKWVLFDLFFISIYQNVLVLTTVFPALASAGRNVDFGWIDYLAAGLMLGFVIYEAIADKQQWNFQQTKWKMIKEGKTLEELPDPYNKGFNTKGLWSVSRHPNYFAEQGTWISLYVFSIASGVGYFNWSIIGSLLLIILFIGSSTFAEEISSSKYPLYQDYQKYVSRFFPWKKYKN